MVDDDAERALLVGAQAGDEDAFRQLVRLNRGTVHALCYRMLGSFQDAEDAYQDTMLRAWRALDGFDGRSRLVTWLHRIATNVCLSALQRTARRRVLPADLDDAEHVDSWIGPSPDIMVGVPAGQIDPSASFERRESLELAFVAALQLLPARQRAALILCEVLGFTAAEVADTLDTSVAAVNSALQRARARLDAARPTSSQCELRTALGDEHVAQVVERFATALEDGDTDALTALLADDVVFEMPPHHATARSRHAVSMSWLVPTARPTGLRTVITPVNAQPAVAVYRDADRVAGATPIAVDVLWIDTRGITHSPPTDWITAHPDAPFHCIMEGVPAAISTARRLAGDGDVNVAAGEIAGQRLELGLLDEAAIDLVSPTRPWSRPGPT